MQLGRKPCQGSHRARQPTRSWRPAAQALRELVVRCWDADPEKRPSFEEVILILEALLKKIPREGAAPGGGGCCTIQ